MGNLLHYAIVFLVVALVAALFGFGGVAGTAMEGAKILFWVAIVLFVVSLVANTACVTTMFQGKSRSQNGIAVRNNFNVKTSLNETARSLSSSDTSILTEAVVLSCVLVIVWSMPSYEVIGKHVFMLAPIRRATKEALFLRTSASIPRSCQPNAPPRLASKTGP
jgi:uncharacterized membrane protein YtjA (UPF0391 family)